MVKKMRWCLWVVEECWWQKCNGDVIVSDSSITAEVRSVSLRQLLNEQTVRYHLRFVGFIIRCQYGTDILLTRFLWEAIYYLSEGEMVGQTISGIKERFVAVLVLVNHTPELLWTELLGLLLPKCSFELTTTDDSNILNESSSTISMF